MRENRCNDQGCEIRQASEVVWRVFGNQKRLVIHLIDEGQSTSQVAKTFGVHIATVYRVLENSRELLAQSGSFLRAIRSRFELGVELKLIWSSGSSHCINDLHTAEWMDLTREELLLIFTRVASEVA